MPYSWRIGALVGLALTLVLYDRIMGRDWVERAWTYGLLLVSGGLGAAYGATHNAITCAISPYYFIWGKGLDAGGAHQAMILGGQAGFAAGAIACAIWQYALRRSPVRARALLIARFCWLPAGLAIVLASFFPVVFTGLDPLGLGVELAEGPVPESAMLQVLAVWWIHAGTYSGAVIGLVAGIALARRAQSKQCTPT